MFRRSLGKAVREFLIGAEPVLQPSHRCLDPRTRALEGVTKVLIAACLDDPGLLAACGCKAAQALIETVTVDAAECQVEVRRRSHASIKLDPP